MKARSKMSGKSGKNWSETKDMRSMYGITPKKPEPDDKPARVKGSKSLMKRLRIQNGKVIS